jgi:RNA polymerase sigma factor (sigma-70 family)
MLAATTDTDHASQRAAVKVRHLHAHYLIGVDDVQVTEASDVEQVYRDSGMRLWWSLLAYTGDPEIASDATAEAFARALTSVETIRDPAGWVWRVAFRVATAELRNARRTVPHDDRSYEMDDRAVAVMIALERLSPKQRAALVLFYLEDRPAKEIAGLLDMNVATVSVHLHRARRRLRTILGDDDY